ncbi:MAG: hypothetical protein AMJ56_07315 [Anaerolineae bacterium SG8_19]|nr:MAG: hypothetical protein AMJ56_07315 [Anaerolineae bacterium SG8_19]
MSDQTNENAQSSIKQQKSMGKELRKQTPRSSHGDWVPAADRPDPISLLQAQDTGRLQHLIPIKYGRMLESPFAFLRGSAVVMASDLASTPTTGLKVVLCGDAHLSNFGVFATPERNLVFDINDFDESYPGPWEWDLKRLATSAVVAGRENGFSDKKCKKLATIVSKSYRESMGRFAQAHILDVWYFHVDADRALKVFDKYAGKGAKGAQKTVKKARSRTRQQTLNKLTEVVDGKRQIVSDPPLLVPLRQLLSDDQKERISQQDTKKLWLEYVDSLPVERRLLLSRFRITDVALRVGGVGSVGTRCTIALLEGDADDEDDALILQQKEAGPSVLEAYLPKRGYASQSQRVVIGRRLMQASSDIFLGWNRGLTGIQYYWRQLKDMKGSFDVTRLNAKGLGTYLGLCGVCLARAHARTGDPIAISGYLGSGDVFDKAISNFALAYADRTERDHQALVDAVESGRIVAEVGV